MSKVRRSKLVFLLSILIIIGSLSAAVATSEASTQYWENGILYLGIGDMLLQYVNYFSIVAVAFYSSDYCSQARDYASLAKTYIGYGFVNIYYAYLSEPFNANAQKALSNASDCYQYIDYVKYYTDYSCGYYNYYYLIDAIDNAVKADKSNLLATGYSYSCLCE